MQLSGIDLNQLVVLEALLRTGSVKAAASEVALSPSAVSHALSRLREVFDDALLLRAGRNMVRTPRGEQLLPLAREALAAAEAVFTPPEHVRPEALQRRFRVLSTDYVELVLIQPLSAALMGAAPGVELFSQRTGKPVAEALREGGLDLALGVYFEELPDVVRRTLFDERFVCVLRRGHPLLHGEGLSLDRFCAADHLLVSPSGDGRGVVDRMLEAQGRSRRVARTVPGFLVAPHMLAGTDLVLTLASRLARRYAGYLDLEVVEPPLELPRFEVSMLWHERWRKDPAHRWFRRFVEEMGVGVVSR